MRLSVRLSALVHRRDSGMEESSRNKARMEVSESPSRQLTHYFHVVLIIYAVQCGPNFSVRKFSDNTLVCDYKINGICQQDFHVTILIR